MDASNMNDLVCCLCQFLAMGHDNHTFLFLVCNVLQQVNHIPSGGFVQIARWFICQQHLGIAGQGAGDGYPLLLTTGKLQDAAVPVFLSDPHAAQQCFGVALAAQLYIFQRSKIVNQVVALEYQRNVVTAVLCQVFRGDGLSVITNLSLNGYIKTRASLLETLKNGCSLYPVVWLGVLVLMYFLSRFLIGKAVEPVEDTMKSQKEFIASASHELKAPLAVIQANAETMESSQKQKIILDECSRMSKLVQSMLALASSDARNWKMDIRETDVDTLLIETWEKFSESARKKNIRLNLDIEDHYPKTHCDKERISQVLGILLDNAISYSSPGQTIEMGAKVLPQKLAFFVIDHGPGIADAEKAKVFERFYSGDPSRTDKSHFGLGLSIAQEIVRLHHGTIRLTDTPGGGCTFEICLPIEKRLANTKQKSTKTAPMS